MGKLAEIKTKPTAASVQEFIASVDNEQKRVDSLKILELMSQASKEEPQMWGSSIIGFGNLRYKSPATGREVEWFYVGFAPRKANLTFYLGTSLARYENSLKKLGKYKAGKGCLYINKLSEVDMLVLEEIIKLAAKEFV